MKGIIGATRAGYVMVRLPHELKGLFREWLDTHLPLRADHVQSLVRHLRGGRDYDSRFGTRMTGEGPFADLVAKRFKIAAARLGYDVGRQEPLDESQFVPPRKPTPQGELF
jgi:DNA repair photolyase